MTTAVVPESFVAMAAAQGVTVEQLAAAVTQAVCELAEELAREESAA